MPASNNSSSKRIARGGSKAQSDREKIKKRPSPSNHAPWTFLTNHAHVLIVLYADPDLVLREVATKVGITERAVQRIVQELEEGGYLRREKIGRQNHYQIITGKHLRHHVESHCTIDQILKLISKQTITN